MFSLRAPLRALPRRRLRLALCRRMLATPPPTVVYTDGACRNNGQRGARAGVGVYFGKRDARNVSQPLAGSRQTNQRAELTAALHALQAVPVGDPIEIRSDSHYVVRGACEYLARWRLTGFAVANPDLWRAISEQLEARDNAGGITVWRWVKAHSGVAGNEGADELARRGIDVDEDNDEPTAQFDSDEIDNKIQP